MRYLLAGVANRIDTLPKRVVMFRPSVESRTSRNAGNDELGQNDTTVQVGNKTDKHHDSHGFGVGKDRKNLETLGKQRPLTPQQQSPQCLNTPERHFWQKKRVFLNFGRDILPQPPEKYLKKDIFFLTLFLLCGRLFK